jgi:hypothetical protein
MRAVCVVYEVDGGCRVTLHPDADAVTVAAAVLRLAVQLGKDPCEVLRAAGAASVEQGETAPPIVLYGGTE